MARAATNSDSFNAVAEPRRREILNYLALQERAVGDMVVGLKMEQLSVSKHLRGCGMSGWSRCDETRGICSRTNAEAIRPLHEWNKPFGALWQHQLIRGKVRAGGLEKGKKMSTGSKATAFTAREHSEEEGAEHRLKELAIRLPTPPKPFGTYAEAVQTGKLLFLTGMLPTGGSEAKFIGRVGLELDVEVGRKAARLAALIARQGDADRTPGRVGGHIRRCRDQPKVADAASELLQEVFGKEKKPCRLVYGVASLPLGAPVELEVIFEVG